MKHTLITLSILAGCASLMLSCKQDKIEPVVDDPNAEYDFSFSLSADENISVSPQWKAGDVAGLCKDGGVGSLKSAELSEENCNGDAADFNFKSQKGSYRFFDP